MISALLLLLSLVSANNNSVALYKEVLTGTAVCSSAEALAHDPQWCPRDADDIVPLAHAAFMAGQSPLAAHLIRGFDRRHREHPHIPSAYLLGAKLLMLQGEAQHVQARGVLTHLNACFPESQEAIESQPLLTALDEWDRQRAAAAALDRAD
jgi:hypothetical protein